MKLPRYNASGNTGAPIQVGNNPSGGGQVGQALADLGGTMMNNLTAYGQAKIKQEARLRDLDIYNKRQMASADVELEMLKFTDDLKTRNDYSNFENDFVAKFKDISKKTKAKHFKGDDFAHSKFEGDQQLMYVEYYKNVLSEKNSKTIKVAQFNYDNNTSTTKNNIAAANSAAEIDFAFDVWVETVHKPFENTMYGTSGNETSVTAFNEMKQYAEGEYLLKLAGDGAEMIQSPVGNKAMNWEQIADNAANPDFTMSDLDGNALNVDDPKRKDFIKMARGKRDEQKTFFDKQRTEQAFQNNQALTNRLTAVIDSKKPDENFVEDVQNDKFLSGETKRTLVTAYKTALKPDTTIESHKTPQAIQAQTIIRTLINTGVLDSQREKQLIIEAANKGFLDGTTYTTLLEKVDSNIRNANKGDMVIVKMNMKTIMKDLGDQNLMDVFGYDMQNFENVDTNMLLNRVFNSNISPKSQRALENMFALIEEGQRKGISIREMFDPRNDKNVGVLVREAYKADTYNGLSDAMKEIYGGEDFVAQRLTDSTGATTDFKFVGIKDAIGSKAFRISPEAFFNSYQAIENYPADQTPLPSKLEGETIGEYLNRVGTSINFNTAGGTLFNSSSVSLSDDDVKVGDPDQ